MTKDTLYPLRFEPIFREYLWGGRRLGDVLGKPIGQGDHFAESWEIVDHGADQTAVAAGPLAGTPLGQIVANHGQALLGRHHPQTQFPLLFKFLDAQQNLSVQVHPNDEQAARQQPPDLGKTEAWYVLDAQPGSVIYAGLKRGFDRAALEREMNRGTTELCLHKIEPKPGDCVFIPAGTVHAIGAGLLVAEIQQASDTTFRLFDWNRVAADGQPRTLHIEQGLNVIRFDAEPVTVQPPQATDDAAVRRLVACDKFVLDRCQLTEPRSIGGDDRFHILAVTEGSITIENDPLAAPLTYGETCLLPASGTAHIDVPGGSATVLDMYLP